MAPMKRFNIMKRMTKELEISSPPSADMSFWLESMK